MASVSSFAQKAKKAQEPSIQPQYNSYRGLIMAGYQGWFSAPDDGSGVNPGSLYDSRHDHCGMDFWPDTREYEKLYPTKYKMADIIMPRFVGRYEDDTYKSFAPNIDEDIKWAKANDIDYAPLCYPGFSWYNMDPKADDTINRNSGSFYWEQLSYCISHGAEMIYVAMFDEMNEGTAIFKCAKDVPVPTEHTRFVPIDDDCETDHYLWLTGKAGAMLKDLISKVPQRK